MGREACREVYIPTMVQGGIQGGIYPPRYTHREAYGHIPPWVHTQRGILAYTPPGTHREAYWAYTPL